MGEFGQHLLATSAFSFTAGFALATTLLTSFVSFGFFILFRDRNLLYFPVIIISRFGLAASLGTPIYPPPSEWGLWALQLIVRLLLLASTYCIYKLFSSTVAEEARRSWWMLIFRIVTFVHMALIFFSFFTTKLMSQLIFEPSVLAFYAVTLLLILTLPMAEKSNILSRIGCFLFALHPFVGILSRLTGNPESSELGSLRLLIATCLAGVVWLFGIVVAARKERELQRRNRLKELSTEFLNLRDLMNTPLQAMNVAVDMLAETRAADEEMIEVLQKAIEKMKKTKMMLNKYQDEDWVEV